MRLVTPLPVWVTEERNDSALATIVDRQSIGAKAFWVQFSRIAGVWLFTDNAQDISNATSEGTHDSTSTFG